MSWKEAEVPQWSSSQASGENRTWSNTYNTVSHKLDREGGRDEKESKMSEAKHVQSATRKSSWTKKRG